MKTYKDILENPELKQNPYSVPDGYFSSMEEKVKDVISASEARAPEGLAKFKPALALACMFLIFFGIGYGLSTLTGILYQPEQETVPDNIHAFVEEGYLDYDFIEDYIMNELSDSHIEQTNSLDKEIDEYLTQTLSVEEIHYYLSQN